MLTVAESYFESDDFRGDVILHAAFPHPLLKRLIRFERGPDSLMRTDDRADVLSRYFEPRVYQRNRAHLCLPGPRYSPPRPERMRRQAPRMGLTDSSSEALRE
jgi:hypothetical protein